MKIIPIKQNTPEWIKWRRTKICASECSSILGVNPWKSIHKLYEEKVFDFEQEENENMRRGKEMEPKALEAFENDYNYTMFPMVVERDELNWMAASLDGMSIDQSQFVEIKCGRKSFEQVEMGEIAPYYISQIQHQLAVTGLQKCFYYCFNGRHGICKEIHRDQEYIDNPIAKESEFWDCLKNLKPPKLNL